MNFNFNKTLFIFICNVFFLSMCCAKNYITESLLNSFSGNHNNYYYSNNNNNNRNKFIIERNDIQYEENINGFPVVVDSSASASSSSSSATTTTQTASTPTTSTTSTTTTTTAPTSVPIINTLWNSLTWFNPIAKDIPYNPDTDLNTCEIATRHGYPAEAYTVETEDGYLLTLHRIPCGKIGCNENDKRNNNRIPVFLQHGLLSSSADWLISGPENGLAFILADNGYDVWLGNARGNTYSKGHVTFKRDDPKYWDFSWHEMALYDIPAEIDYIYKIRDMDTTKLLYIGHSMGSTMLFAMLSMRPEYNGKIKSAFALAPVAYTSHVKSPIRLLAPFSKDIQMIVKFLGGNEFLPHNKIIEVLARYGCDLTLAERYVCKNTLFVLCGFDKAQFNETLMPVIFGHTPAGTSTKTIVHYAQEIHENGNFQQFDYGTVENLARYGQETPPQYYIGNITTPIALFYARNDWLAAPRDVATLYEQLKKISIGMFEVPLEQFNHVDFMWGIDAPQLVYKQLLQLMQNHQ